MKEKIKHIEAFEYYFNLIEKEYTITQAIKATAEHMGVKERTMWKWYKELGWKVKQDKKSEEIAKLVDKKSTKEFAENRIKYLKIFHKILDKFIKDDFPVEIQTMRDLDTVVKNCLVLQDRPTEVVKTTNTNHNVEVNDLFDEELMKQILEEEEEELEKEKNE